MKAKSIKGKSVTEIEQALNKAMEGDFSPSLAIIFISVKQDREAIVKLFSQRSIAVYGATTNGEFIDEEYDTGTIAILLLDINPSYFFIQFAELDGKQDREISRSLAREAIEKIKRPAFVVTGSDLQTDIEELLGGFIDVVGKNANIAGGMAGDEFSFSNQFVFTNTQSSNRAVISLVFDENNVLVMTRAIHGWTAVGTEKTVTHSEGNRVYTVDNTPILDLCLKYSGLPIDHPKLIEELVMNFPLQLQREEGGPLMRPAYHIHWEDHSMLTSGKLPTGSKVRFSLPPDFDVIDRVIDENKKMKEAELPDPDALIIYNCGGRLMSLGPLIGEEIKGMKEVWNIPMAGMFSNAEIGRTPNGNLEMHNLTTCWVVLKEKQ
jgi:hypothetical protein